MRTRQAPVYNSLEMEIVNLMQEKSTFQDVDLHEDEASSCLQLSRNETGNLLQEESTFQQLVYHTRMLCYRTFWSSMCGDK